MDRIRKALDLAREDRRRIADTKVENRLEDQNRLEDRRTEPKPVTRLPTVIEYTKTRVFMPSESVLEANRILDAASRHPAASAFRALRTQVLQRLDEHQWRSVAIFSPSSNDGKTTTAINLAISLASDHSHSVLLIDFDLKRPTLAARFGFTPDQGSDDLLRGEANIESCMYHPKGFERLVILPARAAMTRSSEALAGPACRRIVAELRGRYPDRVLLFDLPPVLGADDALAFAPLIECGLIVVAEGTTRREDLLRSMELLRRTPIIGTVLIRATEVASGYG